MLFLTAITTCPKAGVRTTQRLGRPCVGALGLRHRLERGGVDAQRLGRRHHRIQVRLGGHGGTGEQPHPVVVIRLGGRKGEGVGWGGVGLMRVD